MTVYQMYGGVLMKYANIFSSDGGTGLGSDESINIGDTFQYLAIQEIFNEMGISSSEIVHISKNELWNYDGEELVLPINCLFTNYTSETSMFPLSPKIKPIFIGVSFGGIELSENDIEYLKKHEPIGCRDEYTRDSLRSLGVVAYTAGCISASLSEHASEGEREKVYLIDLPENVSCFFRNRYKNQCVEKSHILTSGIPNVELYVQDRYQEYLNNAKVVITGRLHAAIPCATAGIPVIFIVDKFYSTYSWMEKWFPIYTFNDLDKIALLPETNDYENIKSIMRALVIKRLKNIQDINEEINKIDNFYTNRESNDYYREIDTIYQFINQKWIEKGRKEYCLWGITPYAEMIYNYIQRNYSEAVLSAVFDKYREVDFKGISSLTLDKLRNFSNTYIFVTGYRASIEAKRLLQEMGWKEDKYCLLYEIEEK